MRARIENITAVWDGGPYVDICINGKAVEVINVWDYERGGPLTTAPRTSRQLRLLLTAWLEDNEDNLANYAPAIT